MDILKTPCWLLPPIRYGYAQVVLSYAANNFKRQQAHRTAYEIAHGIQLPDDVLVCHKCDVRNCVNPDHLFLGKHKDNTADMMRKRRNNRNKLSREDIRKILADGRYQWQIAKDFGVTQATISRIKLGQYLEPENV